MALIVDIMKNIIDNIETSIEKNIDVKNQYYEQSGSDMFDSLFNTGARGEYLTYKIISNYSDKNYCVANCYIPKEDGSTSEIDMLMVHETGIYVFESKNYGGWIYGSQNSSKWMQILPAGKGRSERHQFYNPIWQNQTHIKYLKKYLGVNVPFYSYIVFSERCRFRDVQSNDDVRVIHRYDLNRVIKEDISGRVECLTESQMDEIFRVLSTLSSKSKEEKREHVQEIKDKKNRIKEGICPRCGGRLVLRTVKNGANPGSQFYGCSNYPSCKFTTKHL